MKEKIEENKCYYVYMHISPSGKKYIGITGQNPPEKRWLNGEGYAYNIHFYRAIQKYGWNNFEHKILFSGLTKEEAEEKEIEFISLYDSTNIDNGYNVMSGGICVPKWSDEAKENLSNIMKKRFSLPENNPMYGKHHSEETKRKISLAGKNRKHSEETKMKISKSLSGENNPHYGKHLSQETKRKISIAHKGKKLSEEHKRKIGESCRGLLVGDKNPNYGKHMSEEHKKKLIEARRESAYKPVLQYTKDNVFINKFNSIKEANKKTGVNYTSISSCCNGRLKYAGGYIWRFEKDVELKVGDLCA